MLYVLFFQEISFQSCISSRLAIVMCQSLGASIFMLNMG